MKYVEDVSARGSEICVPMCRLWRHSVGQARVVSAVYRLLRENGLLELWMRAGQYWIWHN